MRIFKIGAVRIAEDASLSGLSVEEVRLRLKPLYPEIAHATVRETTTADGQTIVTYSVVAGRKG